MSWDFLHPDHSIDKHGVHLPHWQQDEVMQFVTFRLGDALPRTRVLQWKRESEAWKSTWPPPWDAETTAKYHQRFTLKLERWLDEGTGSCLFREPHVRKIMEETLMHFQEERVEHHSWVIMPNHLHVLFKPMSPLERLVQTWKSISSRQIGKGSIWQPNYRDTMIRDGEHFANAVRYIRNNPAKAKLRIGEYTLWESKRAKAIP